MLGFESNIEKAIVKVNALWGSKIEVDINRVLMQLNEKYFLEKLRCW